MFLRISPGLFVSILSILSYNGAGAMEEDQQSAQKSLSKSDGASRTEKRDPEYTQKLEAALKNVENSIICTQCLIEDKDYPSGFRPNFIVEQELKFLTCLKPQISRIKTLHLDLDFFPFFDQMEGWLTYPGEHRLPKWDELLSHLGRTYMEEHLSKFSLTEIINIGFSLQKSHPRSMGAIEWNKDSFPLKGESTYQEQRKKLEDEMNHLLSQEEKKFETRLGIMSENFIKKKTSLLLLLNSSRET